MSQFAFGVLSALVFPNPRTHSIRVRPNWTSFCPRYCAFLSVEQRSFLTNPRLPQSTTTISINMSAPFQPGQSSRPARKPDVKKKLVVVGDGTRDRHIPCHNHHSYTLIPPRWLRQDMSTHCIRRESISGGEHYLIYIQSIY